MDLPLHIDPKVDIVFQAIFADPAHEAIRIDFLSAVFGLDLREAIVQNPFNLAQFEDHKTVIVDVLAKDAEGRTYQVEMQRRSHAGLRQRMIYDWARIYGRQVERGEPFTVLRPVLSVWICEDDIVRECPRAHLQFQLREKVDQTILHPDLRIDVLQLNRWKIERENLLHTQAGRWFWFFNEAASATQIPTTLLTPAIEEAMDVLSHFRTDENLARMYENRLSVERIIAGNNMERDAALKRAEELEQAIQRIDEQRRSEVAAVEEQRRVEAKRAKEADEQRRKEVAEAEEQRKIEAERANEADERAKALAAELARLRARYGET